MSFSLWLLLQKTLSFRKENPQGRTRTTLSLNFLEKKNPKDHKKGVFFSKTLYFSFFLENPSLKFLVSKKKRTFLVFFPKERIITRKVLWKGKCFFVVFWKVKTFFFTLKRAFHFGCFFKKHFSCLFPWKRKVFFLTLKGFFFPKHFSGWFSFSLENLCVLCYPLG